MKKILSTLLCVYMMVVVFPVVVSADMGPKPSVVINFHGLEGTPYYVTLLSEKISTGPYSALGNEGRKNYSYYNEPEGYEVFRHFVEYEDPDGFFFLQYYENCTQSHKFSWTYHPPEIFKILLYLPEADRFIVSDEQYECYAFDSYYEVEITDTILSAEGKITGGIIAEESYNFAVEIPSLIVRILLTLAIEIGIAWLFKFGEKRQIRFIIFVNLVTQIALNVALNFINFHYGRLAFYSLYILLEIAITALEAILYTVYFKRDGEKGQPYRKPYVYALVANSASFILGMYLALYLPEFF